MLEIEITPMKKPTYSTTKTALNWSLVLGWVVLLALTGGALAGQRLAVEMAWIMAPSMVALIAALLGIHRAFGSMDMRTMALKGAPHLRKAKAEDAA